MKKENKKSYVKLMISLITLVIIAIVSFMFFPKGNKEEKEVIGLLKEYEDKIGSLDNLKYVNRFDDDFNFAQYYKGIEVYGGTLIAIKNKDDISQVLNYQYNIPDDFNVTPVSKREDLNNIIKEHFGSDDVEVKLIIYPLSDNEFVLAHYCYKGSKCVILKDGDHELLAPFNEIYAANSSDLSNIDNLREYLLSFEIKENKFRLYDQTRNIEVYRIKDNDSSKYIRDVEYLGDSESYYKSIIWKKIEDAQEKYMTEINTMQTVQKVYDYYQEVFGFRSIKLNEDYKLQVFTNMYSILLPEDKTKYKIYDNNAFLYTSDEGEIRIYLGAQNKYNKNIEAIGHEYTHGYFKTIVDPILSGITLREYRNGVIKSINEGYADIMGQIIEAYYSDDKKIDGIIDDRNIKESKMKLTDYNSNMDEHDASFIVSRVAYLMANNEKLNLSLEDLANIWFRSLYKLPKHRVTFRSVEVAVLSEAKKLGYNNDKIKEIARVFTEVGYDDLSYLFTEDNIVIARHIFSDLKNDVETIFKNDNVQIGIYANADESSIVSIQENKKCVVIDRENNIFGNCSYEIRRSDENRNSYNIVFKLYDGSTTYYTIDSDKQLSRSNDVLTLVDLSKSKKSLKPGTYKNDNMPEVSLTITLNDDHTCHYKGISDSSLSDIDADCTYKYQRGLDYGRLEDYIILEFNNGKAESFEIQDSENMNSQWLMLKYVND